MPSTYAHRCFGRQVLAALPQEMQQLLRPEQLLHFLRQCRKHLPAEAAVRIS